MAPADRPRLLFTGRLNRRGTTEAQFRFPAGITGNYPMRYTVDTPIGSTEFTQQVRLEDKASILLTTEKPIYQPGQTIHVRALALDRASHEATAGRKLTLEVEDSRGNKVFKKVTQTDEYGVASAEFGLADEVNLGTWHLRALMDNAAGGTANTAEIALNVERYVLPKFKVAVEFASKDTHAKRGYRPGDHVTGTVRANYFFGKPVDRAEITVKGSAMDVALAGAGSSQGKTDSDGAYRFDLQLARLLRRTAAESRHRPRADRGHRQGFRRPCRNSRRTHRRQRESRSSSPPSPKAARWCRTLKTRSSCWPPTPTARRPPPP